VIHYTLEKKKQKETLLLVLTKLMKKIKILYKCRGHQGSMLKGPKLYLHSHHQEVEGYKYNLLNV
jgi:hypothetical protein